MFVTKVAHSEACSELAKVRESACMELQVSLDVLKEDKASSQEVLTIGLASLKAAHESLGQEHAETARELERASRGVAELERRAAEELASRESMESAQRTLTQMQ